MMRKAVVAGGRDFDNKSLLHETLCLLLRPDDAVICGMAKGADLLGKAWADHQGVKVIEMPADWDTHKKAAGPIRNQQMAQAGDFLIVFWDGKSRGSKDMIEKATRQGMDVHIIRYQT